MDYHIPVLAAESLSALKVKSNGIYIDATLGNGGHTIEILKQKGIVYGFDLDPNNLEIATQRIKLAGFEENFYPINTNFNQLEKIVNDTIKNKVDGIIIDLGLSQNQQKASDRGFSFNDPYSLDMRINPKTQKVTAEEIINTASFDELYQIFTKYGQELRSKPIIQRIISARQKSPIKSGLKLAEIIRNYYKEHHVPSKIDPSTKIFMSLRIFINQEFDNLKTVLDQTMRTVKSGGVVCVITFHSGEDRIVKQFIKDKFNSNLVSSISKPIKAKYEEIKHNPLSRSATLRSYTIV